MENKEKAYDIKKTAARIAADIRQFRAVILVVCAVWLGMNAVFGGVCPVPLVTGFPCPGCGMSRAVCYLLAGNWEASLAANPMAVFWMAGVAYFFVMRYIFGKKAPGAGIYFLLTAVCTAAVYGYRMYTCFPSAEPLVYHAGNLLEKMVPQYRLFFR